MSYESAEDKEQKQELKRKQLQDLGAQVAWATYLPPINKSDPLQVKTRIKQYFDKCVEEGWIVGQEGMCSALGIDRQTFNRWLNGTARMGQEHQLICKQAEQFLVSYMEAGIMNGTLPPIPSIFMMSNQHGYVQKQTVVQEQAGTFIDTATPEQLEARYGSGSIIDAVIEEKEVEKLPIAETQKDDV